MIGKAVAQGACIGLVAAAIGTVHALGWPIATWNTAPKPAAPVPQPAPVQPSQPVGATPVQPKPPTPSATQQTPAQPAPRDDRMITLARFKELMSGALPLQIIDAREPAEFAAGHIPGAVNLSPSAFSGGIPDVVNQRLSRDLPVVVYCSGGNCDASKSVALRLMDLGFTQTVVYEDGYTGWTKAGEAVEK